MKKLMILSGVLAGVLSLGGCSLLDDDYVGSSFSSYQTTSSKSRNDDKSDAYSSKGTWYHTEGKNTFGSNGTAYRRDGDYIFGTDGNVYYQKGGNIISSDGTFYHKKDDYIYGSNGTIIYAGK